MARSAKQLLEQMRKSPNGYGEQDMKAVLTANGSKKARKGGKHTVYQHETHADLKISIPRNRNLRDWVARDVVSLMDVLASRR